MYGQIQNSKVVRIFAAKPHWLDDQGHIISDDELIQENIFPIDTTFHRSVDFEKERLVVNSLNNMVIDFTNKKIKNYFISTSFSLEEVYESKVKELELTKNQRVFVNLRYTFPDNMLGIVQLRNQIDLDNINTLYADAVFAITSNLDKNYSFKDEANVSHEMNTYQMSELGSFVKAHYDKVFLEYWDLKHNKLDPIYNNISKSESDRINDILSIIWK
jgi:hypothetical protein